ncbi:hypothetical protein OSB04_030584 [Centaurea solstitialis]|uniref:non-specific serine/threonine protein kinase n=1 Tax=Centaurea solstitialis TaxID=347529 RepID=A0AA38SK46_9ASTR|nr:hypothetical protein OSB04_030584 [Centaurea solstitialis]
MIMKMDYLKSSSSSSQHLIAEVVVVVIFLFFFSNGASGATFTVVNDCGFTVWPRISTNYSEIEFNITGFELTKGTSRSFEVSVGWRGSIWGRTGCTFDGSGRGSCATGACGTHEMECSRDAAKPTATIAEFSLNKDLDMDYFYRSPDYYDVSLINGYNIQMLVEATNVVDSTQSSCSKAGCIGDLNQRCPKELSLEGRTGCMSPCQAFGTPEYCCNNSLPCEPTQYAQLFKSACPRSIAYPTDDTTSTFTCLGGNYTIRFCPPSYALSIIIGSTDKLVSKSGKFTLGFFETDHSYLGIWHSHDVQSRKVWVGNPNAPIKSTSGTHALSIDPKTGNLIIVVGGKTLMNLTDLQAGPNPSLTTTLEDNGNFLLINAVDTSILWQSFDHPTNILLPGMKLGSNMKTSHTLTLTSWLSDQISDSGAFILSWEPMEEASQRLTIRRRGKPYWTSGNLYNQTFQYMFELNYPNSQSRYNLTSIYNNEERYFMYEYEGSEDDLHMWILTPKGQILDGNQNTVWTPEFCYGYNSGDGCIESSLIQCRREVDYFSENNGDFAPDMTKYIVDDNSSLSISDCFVKCWNDCTCAGFANSTSNGTGCAIWSGSNSFMVNPRNSSTLKYVISQNAIIPSTGNRTEKKKNWRWILLSVAIPLVCVSLGILWYINKRKHQREEYERRQRDEYFLELTASESFMDVHQLEGNGGNGKDLSLFSLVSILAATNDFSVENKIGQGGFGPVYKGKLHDGREIAVKRLSRTSGQGLVEFKNELILIAKLQHTNLVRVLGCCIHKEEKMLIYEYMPNKSLDFFLFDENRRGEMDWPKRYNIIEGIAQGLLYLHKYSRMRVIHRDLKANNILLDEGMNPKISDFGMARIFKQNETEAMTNRVVGTYGYMPPEYAMEGTFSIKSDIFSFGVLLLEIVTGRRNSSFVHLDRTFNLIEYAWELWRQGDALRLMDSTLGSTCVVQQFLRTVQVALLCVQESATDRPTTSDMISMLLNDTTLLPTPKKPAFVIRREETRSTSGESGPKDYSINNVTITDMDGR